MKRRSFAPLPRRLLPAVYSGPEIALEEERTCRTCHWGKDVTDIAQFCTYACFHPVIRRANGGEGIDAAAALDEFAPCGFERKLWKRK